MKTLKSKKTNQNILDSARLKDIKITKNRAEIIKLFTNTGINIDTVLHIGIKYVIINV